MTASHFAVGDTVVPINDPECRRTVAEVHPNSPWIRVRHTAADGRVVTSHWVDAACWQFEPIPWTDAEVAAIADQAEATIAKMHPSIRAKLKETP